MRLKLWLGQSRTHMRRLKELLAIVFALDRFHTYVYGEQ